MKNDTARFAGVIGMAVCMIITLLIFERGPFAVQLHAQNQASEATDLPVTMAALGEKLSRESWEGMDRAMREEALRELTIWTCQELGIPYVPDLTVEKEKENLRGEYSHQRRAIFLNQKMLESDDPERAVEVIFHEVRHAYQHCLNDVFEETDSQWHSLALFDMASRIHENLDQYIDAEEDYQAYCEQPVEWDARWYAREMMRLFYPDEEIGSFHPTR